MAFSQLPQREKELIHECMVAIAQGPFLDEWEFQTRIGITRAELMAVLAEWPDFNYASDGAMETLAINNCSNEILHGLFVSPCQWEQWFSGTKEELADAYQHWAQIEGYKATGVM